MKYLLLLLLVIHAVAGLHVRVGSSLNSEIQTRDKGVIHFQKLVQGLVHDVKGFNLLTKEQLKAIEPETGATTESTELTSPLVSADDLSEEELNSFAAASTIKRVDRAHSTIVVKLTEERQGRIKSLPPMKLFIQMEERLLAETVSTNGVRWPDRFQLNNPGINTDLRTYSDALVNFLTDIHERIDERARQLQSVGLSADSLLQLKSLDFLLNWDLDYLLGELGTPQFGFVALADVDDGSAERSVQLLRAAALYMKLVVLEQAVEEQFAVTFYPSIIFEEAKVFLTADAPAHGDGDHIFNPVDKVNQLQLCSKLGLNQNFEKYARKLSAAKWNSEVDPTFKVRGGDDTVFRFSEVFRHGQDGLYLPYQNINGPRWNMVMKLMPTLRFFVAQLRGRDQGNVHRDEATLIVSHITALSVVTAIDVEPLARIACFGRVKLEGMIQQTGTLNAALSRVNDILQMLISLAPAQAQLLVSQWWQL